MPGVDFSVREGLSTRASRGVAQALARIAALIEACRLGDSENDPAVGQPIIRSIGTSASLVCLRTKGLTAGHVLRNDRYAREALVTWRKGDSMAGRKVLAITERQFAVLRVLWERGPLSARGLMEHLPRGDKQPYTTVLGLLQAMEKAGLVEHEKQGLVHLYRPTDSRQQATGNLLADFLAKFFPGIGRAVDRGSSRRQGAAPGDLRAIEARLAATPREAGPEKGKASARAKAEGRKKPR